MIYTYYVVHTQAYTHLVDSEVKAQRDRVQRRAHLVTDEPHILLLGGYNLVLTYVYIGVI